MIKVFQYFSPFPHSVTITIRCTGVHVCQLKCEILFFALNWIAVFKLKPKKKVGFILGLGHQIQPILVTHRWSSKRVKLNSSKAITLMLGLENIFINGNHVRSNMQGGINCTVSQLGDYHHHRYDQYGEHRCLNKQKNKWMCSVSTNKLKKSCFFLPCFKTNGWEDVCKISYSFIFCLRFTYLGQMLKIHWLCQNRMNVSLKSRHWE